VNQQKNYYQILDVSETASADEIKKVYRKLAVRYHPDKNPGNAKESEGKFKEISEAYYVLSDTKRRQQYDQMRKFGGGYSGNFAGAQGFDFEEFLKEFGARGGQGFPSGGKGQSQGRYSSFNGIFSELFETFKTGGAQGSSRRPGARQGTPFYTYSNGEEPDAELETGAQEVDVRVNLRIAKEKAEKGGQVTFRTPEGKTLSVNIPPHTRSNQKLRLVRQGHLCPACQHEGDLILQIKIEP